MPKEKEEEEKKIVAVLESIRHPFPHIYIHENEKKVIGRGKDGITRKLRKISSSHMQVYCKEGKLFIKDISTNGTWVGGERITKNSDLRVMDNSVITFPRDNIPCPSYVYKLITGWSDPRKIDVEEDEDDETLHAGSTLDADEIGQGDDSQTIGKRNRDTIINDSCGIDNDEKLSPSSKKQKVVMNINNLIFLAECGICKEIQYKPTTCVPCDHSFCQHCIGEWRDQGNKTCPTCRRDWKYLKRNRDKANLVEQILQSNPSLKRSDSEKELLEKQSTLTDDELRKIEKEQIDNQNPHPNSFPFPTFSFGGFQVINNDDDDDDNNGCEECNGDGSHDHAQCHLCDKNIPILDNYRAPVKCELCDNYFCNNYFPSCTANNPDLKSLESYTFQNIPERWPSGNRTEIRILKQYMEDNEVEPQDIFEEIIEKLKTGEYSCKNKKYFGFNGVRNIEKVSTDCICCHQCATKVFGELIFYWRMDIPKDSLPDEVNNLVKCYYGYECWTQFDTNRTHDMKLSHIGENTKKNK